VIAPSDIFGVESLAFPLSEVARAELLPIAPCFPTRHDVVLVTLAIVIMAIGPALILLIHWWLPGLAATAAF
jgi:hypothetical protein